MGMFDDQLDQNEVLQQAALARKKMQAEGDQQVESSNQAKRDTGKTAGKAVGGILGAIVGSFVPVLGTAVGGALGGMVGGTAGEGIGATMGGAKSLMAFSKDQLMTGNLGLLQEAAKKRKEMLDSEAAAKAAQELRATPATQSGLGDFNTPVSDTGSMVA